MAGPDENVKETSLSGLLATLAPTALVAAVYFLIFLMLRKSKRRFYAPRTYLGTLREEYVNLIIFYFNPFIPADTRQGTNRTTANRMVQLDWPFLEDTRYLCSSAPVPRCLPLPSISPHDGGHYVCWRLYYLACVSPTSRHDSKFRVEHVLTLM